MAILFVPEDNIDGERVRITGGDAHYLGPVLRLRVSDSFQVVAPTGSEYTAHYRAHCSATIRERHGEASLPLAAGC